MEDERGPGLGGLRGSSVGLETVLFNSCTVTSLLGKSSQVTFIYIALLTIQIVTKHCTISK